MPLFGKITLFFIALRPKYATLRICRILQPWAREDCSGVFLFAFPATACNMMLTGFLYKRHYAVLQ